MGRPKASLEWHGTTLVARAASLLAETLAGPVVVVRAPGQPLPPLPAGVEVATDERPGRGPLEGMAAGLRAIGDRAESVFVSSTDVPLLHPSFVRRVLSGLDGPVDAAVPRTEGRAHPLAASYRISVLGRIETMLASDRLRLTALLSELRVHWLDRDWLLADPELARADGGLDSLANLNDPAAYEAARATFTPAEPRVARPRGAGWS
ncbi:MAG: molybdenum cofactor guanylyltransferase [Thermoleophilia bacterium]|nr:molybdenum cofactor guanylyltransferase [Thermoleophilia bacterium]